MCADKQKPVELVSPLAAFVDYNDSSVLISHEGHPDQRVCTSKLSESPITAFFKTRLFVIQGLVVLERYTPLPAHFYGGGVNSSNTLVF